MPVKLKVKWRVLESTDAENIESEQSPVKSKWTPEPTKEMSMTPEEMAGILDKAMTLIKSNGLLDQMNEQQQQDGQDWQGEGQQNPWGWGQSQQPPDPRKVYYIHTKTQWIKAPVVAYNLRQAVVFSNVSINTITNTIIEEYTNPDGPDAESDPNDWLAVPFVY